MSSFVSRLLNPKIEAVGLEIGTSALKVVELRPGNPPGLVSFGNRPMPPGLVQEDQVVDPEGLAEEIKALYKDAEINKRFVVTAVSNRLAIVRNIQVPKMGAKELDEAIKWEAERYIPFPIDEVTLDYYVLDNPDDVEDESGQLEVVIAAARLDMVSQQMEYLKLAGLEPVVIDIKSFALMRSLRAGLLGDSLSKTSLTGESYQEDEDVNVILEIAAANTSITLLRNDRLLMNRNIGVSGDDFTATIQRAFGLDFDTAEEVKLDYGTAVIPEEVDDEEELLNFDVRREQYSPGKVYEALRPVLVDLTTEVRRSLEFFRVQAGDVEIGRMLLTGGGSKLPGLAEAIADTLEFRVEVADPWLALSIDNDKFDMSYLQSIGGAFSVPLGLALRGVELD
jgi:type IV pilus assembly protein PilM